MNPLKVLQNYGQSFWLDYIRRSLITSGELRRMIEEDGLRGVTSNPTIFQKAIAGSPDYDEILRESVQADSHMNVTALFERLAIQDIQMAADVLRPVYEDSRGVDGFVSFELSPRLARDSEGSIAEAHRLWKTVNRPNVMLKVPATPEGIPVIETLIADGINVNVTLLFSLSHYEAVANAYLTGLERCSDPQKVASVASFFLSRIDRVVDKALEERGSTEALNLRGKIAIASAKLAYKRFKEIFSGERWKRLSRRGGRVQRVLWASTSTKNPAYPDVMYVEELIGPHTVNTVPPMTLNAFRDHGHVGYTIEARQEDAANALRHLTTLDVDLITVTDRLQEEGVTAFADSFASLLTTLEAKRQAILHDQADVRTLKLGQHQQRIDKRLKNWNEVGFLRRLWAKDPTLWFPKPVPEIADRLGWLDLPESMHEKLEALDAFVEEAKAEEKQHVVLLGMGGSSLAPEVFQNTFGNAKGFPELIVLDSTHPAAVRSVEKRIDLRRTIFLVSSKSGTTLETLSLFKYFWEKVGQVTENPGSHFVAVTDPDTPLTKLAYQSGFRHIFPATPDVGGRYSALTVFGLLPAALIGLDVHKFLDRSLIMSENCAFCVSSREATGLVLAAALGELATLGRDKITFLTSPSIRYFPVWLEQLIAESTGKEGKGIIPIVDEPIASPDVYGDDRVFVYFFCETDKDEPLRELADRLEAKGHPTVRINMTEKMNISQEIFYWEVAVAAAGAVLGIHPFNQPNVQMAKDLAKKMMDQGAFSQKGVETVSGGDRKTLVTALKSWLSQARAGDYIAIQAYLPPTPDTTSILQRVRRELLTRFRLATTLGYGPRFLHSTGQLHKGGQNTGLFLQLIDEPSEDLRVPETNYTFNTLIQAQALGDYLALKQLGRRVLRINLQRDVATGLQGLYTLLHEHESLFEKMEVKEI